MIGSGLSVSGHRYRKFGHRRTVPAPGKDFSHSIRGLSATLPLPDSGRVARHSGPVCIWVLKHIVDTIRHPTQYPPTPRWVAAARQEWAVIVEPADKWRYIDRLVLIPWLRHHAGLRPNGRSTCTAANGACLPKAGYYCPVTLG
jgi:hypothetical protein